MDKAYIFKAFDSKNKKVVELNNNRWIEFNHSGEWYIYEETYTRGKSCILHSGNGVLIVNKPKLISQ